jgi:threonine dehydrogenase-like Zn-dependent dehydrogenase
MPTGWMGADLGGVRPGDVVAVWGCGAVGQMAARAAMLLGAEWVISIDRYPERLAMTERHIARFRSAPHLRPGQATAVARVRPADRGP